MQPNFSFCRFRRLDSRAVGCDCVGFRKHVKGLTESNLNEGQKISYDLEDDRRSGKKSAANLKLA